MFYETPLLIGDDSRYAELIYTLILIEDSL